MKLKAKRNKSYYKNTNAWLDAVYRNNKMFIDDKLQTTGGKSKKTLFKSLVYEYMEEGYTPTKALNTLSKSTVFTEVSERLSQNAFSGLKKDKEAFKQFRKLAGWKTKLDPTKLVYDKAEGLYIYDGRVSIKLSNSPVSVTVDKIA